MENNIIKENQLEVLPKNEITSIIEINKLSIVPDKNNLLPTIINRDALALVEIKKEFYNVKRKSSLYGVTWFIKSVLILFAKLVRYIFLASTRLVSFAMFSVIVILSTTVITKNVVNSLYGIKATTEESTAYSIFSVKDDFEAKAKAEMKESISEDDDTIENEVEDNQGDQETSTEE